MTTESINEKQAAVLDPDVRELADEELEGVAGGGTPPPFNDQAVTCIYCGRPQPNCWTSNECYHCGASLESQLH